jgi:hypothetical protein
MLPSWFSRSLGGAVGNSRGVRSQAIDCKAVPRWYLVGVSPAAMVFVEASGDAETKLDLSKFPGSQASAMALISCSF